MVILPWLAISARSSHFHHPSVYNPLLYWGEVSQNVYNIFLSFGNLCQERFWSHPYRLGTAVVDFLIRKQLRCMLRYILSQWCGFHVYIQFLCCGALLMVSWWNGKSPLLATCEGIWLAPIESKDIRSSLLVFIVTHSSIGAQTTCAKMSCGLDIRVWFSDVILYCVYGVWTGTVRPGLWYWNRMVRAVGRERAKRWTCTPLSHRPFKLLA